jgi:calcineurin-like phosphoesterase family protein
VPGNHDSCHPAWEQTVDHLERQGWSDVFEVVEPNTALLELPGGRQVAVCHFSHTSRPGDRWERWKHHNRALPLVHGHNHARQKVTLPSRAAQRSAGAQGQAVWGLTQIHIGWAAWRQLAPAPAVEELVNEEAPVSR